MRTEQEIFEDLANLCRKPGYIHALATICLRDNLIRFRDELKAEDMVHLFSRERLIRTEITTLIGLMVTGDIDYTLPSVEELSGFIEQTDKLMKELHEGMVKNVFSGIDVEKIKAGFNPFVIGENLREPIFYAGESAYSFQYRDFALPKYKSDNDWLVAHKGFDIETAQKVVAAICRKQDKRHPEIVQSLRGLPPEKWTMLPAFTFTLEEIVEESGLDIDTVKKVVASFTFQGSNSEFQSLSDFNAINGSPIIELPDGKYVILQYYTLLESLYEAPFFWMCKDTAYYQAAAKNRGYFTEAFSKELLEKVFGKDHVYSNVRFLNAIGKDEIDVLVLFGDRAIILQAKSKRLTLPARKGNDLQLREDFKKAVQDAYDQAYECALKLIDRNGQLVDGDGNQIPFPTELKVVHPVCIVADTYPALAFQALQFLEKKEHPTICPPFVTEVFALDAATEMLESPLHFLNYLELRARFGDRVVTMHEHTQLSYHLKRNLWLDNQYSITMFDDDIALDLDVSMMVRREGLPGPRTPNGILTKFLNTPVGNLMKAFEKTDFPPTLDLGLFLLQLSEETIEDLNEGISQILKESKADGQTHDVTIGVSSASSGITIYSSTQTNNEVARKLEAHCETRKYKQKANRWFGLVLAPQTGQVRLGLKVEYPWEYNQGMEDFVKNMRPITKATPKKTKIGRNEPCPCGSGVKYKKCCLSNSPY